MKSGSDDKKIPVHTQPLAYLQRGIEQLFDTFFDGFKVIPRAPHEPLSSDVILQPKVNVLETPRHYQFKAELPGVEEHDLDVSLGEGELIMSGEKKAEQETQDKKLIRIECVYGAFYRAVPLPSDADPEQVSATFKNGILTVEIAKKAVAKTQAKKITVKS